MNKFFWLPGLLFLLVCSAGCQKAEQAASQLPSQPDFTASLPPDFSSAHALFQKQAAPERKPLAAPASPQIFPETASTVSKKKMRIKKSTKQPSQKICLDLQQAEVSHVLRLLADIGGRNLVLGDNVRGKISLHVRDVEWDEVLAIVLRQKSLARVEQGNILRILPAEELDRERQRIFLDRQKNVEEQARAAALTPLQTAYIPVHYAQAQDLANRLQPLLSARGKITPEPRTNLLILSDSPVNIKKIQTALTYLDRPQRQVMIEARLVYATEIFQRNLGLKWGARLPDEARGYLNILGSTYSRSLDLSGLNLFPNPGGFSLAGSVTKLGGDMFTLDLELQLGEQEHTAKTISAPRIATLNNHQARISQGIMIKVTTETGEGKAPVVEYKPAILLLEVRPQITPDNKLILELHIQDDAKTTGEDIDTRSATTRLLVDDGQTIVIGGIQKIEYQTRQHAVPGLSKIPGLSWLFKNNQQDRKKAELLVFIRPKILD